jgi:heat-inducible transcriptional repressor
VCVVRFDLFCVSLTIYTIVLVTDAHAVKNKLVHTPEPVDESALAALNAALNAHLTGFCVNEIDDEMIRVIRVAAGPGAVYLDDVVEFIGETCGSSQNREVYLTGTSHILSHPEYRDSLKARRLIEYLSDGHELTRLPEPDPENPLQIIIGPENVAEQPRDASVVMASYSFGGNVRGLIGVVGPTRMDYPMVLSRLSYFADRLNKLLGEGIPEE